MFWGIVWVIPYIRVLFEAPTIVRHRELPIWLQDLIGFCKVFQGFVQGVYRVRILSLCGASLKV